MFLRLVSKGSFYLCKPHALQYCGKTILSTLPYKVLLHFQKFFILPFTMVGNFPRLMTEQPVSLVVIGMIW